MFGSTPRAPRSPRIVADELKGKLPVISSVVCEA